MMQISILDANKMYNEMHWDISAIQDGPFRHVYEDGTVKYTGFFLRGQEEGAFYWYHSNQNKAATISYTGGKKDGLARLWHENGQLAEQVIYKDNKEEGIFEAFDENGVRTALRLYRDGKLQKDYTGKMNWLQREDDVLAKMGLRRRQTLHLMQDQIQRMTFHHPQLQGPAKQLGYRI